MNNDCYKLLKVHKEVSDFVCCCQFISLYKVILTFKYLDETLRVCVKRVIIRMSYRAVLLCGTVCYAVQGGSNFKVFG